MRAVLPAVLGLAAIAIGVAAVWTVLDATPVAPVADGGPGGAGGQGRLAVPSDLSAQSIVPQEVRQPDPPPEAVPPSPETSSTASTAPATAPATSSPPPPPSPEPPANQTPQEAPQDAQALAEQAAARARLCVTPGWHCRTFTWPFRGGAYWLVMELDSGLYGTYRAEEKPVRLERAAAGWLTTPAYDLYVSDPRDDRFIGLVAAELRRMAGAAGLGPQEEASFVLAFVQSLQYTSDDVTTGFDEYPRYPVETLVDEGGDCEDTSILYASLMGALGARAVLVAPPQHMAVGLDAPGAAGPGVDAGGVHYAYAESTGAGWEIGEVPPEFAGQPMQWWSLDPTPLFTLSDTTASGQGSALQVDARVTNMGTAAADATLVADIRAADGSGTVFSTDRCFLPGVPLRGSAACALHLDLRTVPVGASVRLEVRVEAGGAIGDALETAPFVPWH